MNQNINFYTDKLTTQNTIHPFYIFCNSCRQTKSYGRVFIFPFLLISMVNGDRMIINFIFGKQKVV
jgi:hypothetical protein